MPFRLVVPRRVHEEMIAQALAEQPNECVGLLAGQVEAGVGRVARAYPLTNALASPLRYDADTRALFNAHKDMRDRGLEMLAVYHSHPSAPAIPSTIDHEQWMHGLEVVCLIITLLDSPPTVRAWRLEAGQSHEAEWEVDRQD